MKLALLLVVVLAFGAFAGAQMTPQQEVVEITADSLTEAGNVLQLRGNVQVRRGGSLVTADEADVTRRTELTSAPNSVELRGNVRLTSEDAVGLSLSRR